MICEQILLGFEHHKTANDKAFMPHRFESFNFIMRDLGPVSLMRTAELWPVERLYLSANTEINELAYV